MTFDATITVGNVLAALGPIIAILYGIAKMESRTDEFFRTLNRHEVKLETHETRLNEHGERIAAIQDRRRHGD